MNGEMKSGAGNVNPTLKKMSDYNDPNAVHYTWDAKTEEQKEQARFNIGAAAAKDVEYLKSYVTPQMFGAKGDGVADDTEAVQMAIDMGFELKNPVYLCGNYKITAPLRVKGISSTASRRGSVILGDGYAHIIAGASITNVFEFEPVVDESRTYGIQIKDLIIDGNRNATNGICSNYSTSECIFENITINQCENGVYMNGNCYLNTFRVIRGYHCADYAILFENGNNTSNVFEKCYSDTCANGFKVNGQYSSMISCCVDNATGVPYELHSFKGALVGCGSESSNCVSLLKTSTNANIVLVGGFFYGSPEMSEYYFDVGAGCNVSVYGVTIHNVAAASGALCKLAGGAELKIHSTDLGQGFNGQNIVPGTATLYVNSGVLTTAISVTLDENNEAELGISPATNFILDIKSINRSGWVVTQIIKDNKYFVKVMGSANYCPSISDKNFSLEVNYIQKRNL